MEHSPKWYGCCNVLNESLKQHYHELTIVYHSRNFAHRLGIRRIFVFCNWHNTHPVGYCYYRFNSGRYPQADSGINFITLLKGVLLCETPFLFLTDVQTV